MNSPGGFLRRWSRLKLQEESPSDANKPLTPVVAALPVAQEAPVGDEAVPAPEVAAAATTTLPTIESLDLSSDFTAFLKEEVSESLRRAALKKLFGDPVFNAMDGLDIYIDDYSIPDPIAPDVMQRLKQFETFLADPLAQTESDKEAVPASDTAACDAVQHASAIESAEPAEPMEAVAPAPAPDTLSVVGQSVSAASETAIKHQ